MGHSKDLTIEKKSYISALISNTKLSQRQIAAKTGVSRASVRRLIQKLKTNESYNAARKGKCGRKRLVTPRGKRALRNIAVEFRRATQSEIKNKLAETGVNVSIHTVRRNLYDMGFKCRRPAKKPRLTPAMVKKRYGWACTHKHLTVEDWRIVRRFKSFDFLF